MPVITESIVPITISWYIPEHFNGVEVVEAKELKFDIPFSFGDEVYYAYKKGRKWVLIHSRVDMVALTNIPNIRLQNGMWIDSDRFDRLFTPKHLKEAQEYCIDKNQRETVKIVDKI